MVQNGKLRDEKKKITANLEREKLRNTNLKNRMQMLNKNYYLEKLARDKLGVVQRGDSTYKVIIR